MEQVQPAHEALVWREAKARVLHGRLKTLLSLYQ